ncbi:PKD domain-containing protein [Candidatus Bipolaricaulota bacterium]
MRTIRALTVIASLLLLSGCAALNGLLGTRSPTATISATTIGRHAPLVVLFDASHSEDDGQIVEYAWDFGDGTLETSPSAILIEHVYERAGTFVASLSVTDEDGNTSDASVAVTVENQLPFASCRLSNDAPVVGELVQFDASGSFDADGDLVGFTWDFGDGETMRGTRVSHVYTELGVYEMRLTVEDNAGATGSLTHKMTVHQGGSGGCGGGTICF